MAAGFLGCSDPSLNLMALPRPTRSIHLAAEGAWIPVESRGLVTPFLGLRMGTRGKLLNNVSDFISGLNLVTPIHQAASSTSQFAFNRVLQAANASLETHLPCL